MRVPSEHRPPQPTPAPAKPDSDQTSQSVAAASDDAIPDGAHGGEGASGASEPPRRSPRRRAGSRVVARAIRVAVIHNVDFDDVAFGEAHSPGNAARADVALVAHDIAATLDDAEHRVSIVPVDGDLYRLRERLLASEADVVFNLCESLCGDARLESAVPLVLEGLACAYTGSPPSALSFALYKDRVKAILCAAGVPTPHSQVVRSSRELQPFSYPAIVKPTREDGSIGISSRSVVYDEASCRARVDEVAETFRQPVLVERYVDGREFNVALFGYPTARILPLSEIDFATLPAHLPKIVSYEAKWATGSAEDLGTVPITFPQLPAAVAARIRRVALDAFRALGARDYGRVDVRLAHDGTPFVVDVNPNCDLARAAGLARAAAAVGVDYSAMMRLLVRYALRRRRDTLAVARPALRVVEARSR